MANLLRILGLLAVPVAAAVAFLASFLGYGRPVRYNDSECRLLPDIKPGSEDIAVVDASLALVSAGDLDRLYFKSGGPDRGGEIFALRFDSDGDGVAAEKVPLEGLPDRETFHPHGIGYSNRTRLLYAVSHDCGDRTPEGIEIFRLVREPGLLLRHVRSVRLPSVPPGGLNDVMEGAGPGELYVTQFFTRPVDKKCHGNRDKLVELGVTFDALFRRKTKVLRCVWDPEQPSSEATCQTVAEGFRGANGIAADPERRQVFIVDAPDHALSVFDRNEDGSLVLKDTLDLHPYALDNVEFDVASGKLSLSVSPRLYEILGRMEGDASVKVSGGMITVEPQRNGSYLVDDVLMHDGSKLSMVSAAVFANGKVILGSPLSDGVLVCPIPDKPLASKCT